MDHFVQIWEADYGDRRQFLDAISKVNDEDLKTLNGLALYWSDIPYSLSLFASLAFSTSDEETDGARARAQELLLSAGAKRRLDMTIEDLSGQMGRRALNCETLLGGEPVRDPCKWATRGEFEAKGYDLSGFKPRSRVFMSHQSERKTEVAKLQELLANREVPTWMDAHDIDYGENLTVAINRGINQSTAVIFWISPKFLESRWCEYEFENFIGRYASLNDVLLLSVVEEECVGDIPKSLAQLKYFRLGDSSDVVSVAGELAPILKNIANSRPGQRREGGFGSRI